MIYIYYRCSKYSVQLYLFLFLVSNIFFETNFVFCLPSVIVVTYVCLLPKVIV